VSHELPIVPIPPRLNKPARRHSSATPTSIAATARRRSAAKENGSREPPSLPRPPTTTQPLPAVEAKHPLQRTEASRPGSTPTRQRPSRTRTYAGQRVHSEDTSRRATATRMRRPNSGGVSRMPRSGLSLAPPDPGVSASHRDICSLADRKPILPKSTAPRRPPRTVATAPSDSADLCLGVSPVKVGSARGGGRWAVGGRGLSVCGDGCSARAIRQGRRCVRCLSGRSRRRPSRPGGCG
jgi:hypothetical protein